MFLSSRIVHSDAARRLVLGLAAVAIGIHLLWLLARVLLPQTLVFAAGPEGGGYWQIA